jgi:hypothetical protein
MNKKVYVGNCINSFDEDGDCLLSSLPYSYTTDFAQALDEVTAISYAEFIEKCEPIEVTDTSCEYMQHDNVVIAYDSVTDIHYFFV